MWSNSLCTKALFSHAGSHIQYCILPLSVLPNCNNIVLSNTRAQTNIQYSDIRILISKEIYVQISLYKYILIHTYIHTHIHTYIHTYIYTYLSLVTLVTASEGAVHNMERLPWRGYRK